MRRERERTFRNESGAKGPRDRAMTRMIVLNKKLYVGNIPFSCTEADLRDLFGRHGQVASVKVITDRETGRPARFRVRGDGRERRDRRPCAPSTAASSAAGRCA